MGSCVRNGRLLCANRCSSEEGLWRPTAVMHLCIVNHVRIPLFTNPMRHGCLVAAGALRLGFRSRYFKLVLGKFEAGENLMPSEQRLPAPKHAGCPRWARPAVGSEVSVVHLLSSPQDIGRFQGAVALGMQGDFRIVLCVSVAIAEAALL